MPAISSVSPTGNINIDALLGSYKWAVSNLTYSFPTSASFYGSNYGSGETTNGFGTLNAQQQAAARAAFTQMSAVANVTFTEITETSTTHADLRLALPLAVLAPIAVHLIFSKLLRVPLPIGLLPMPW